MMNLENLLVCLAAPLIIALFLTHGEARWFIGFFVLGLLVCLLSAYINTFFVAVMDNGDYVMLATRAIIVQLTPVNEEVLKALPVFFLVAFYKPRPRDIITVAIAVGLGFATLENLAYILQYSAGDLWFTVVRGFSSGVLHTVCAAILGFGLSLIVGKKYLILPGSFALLCFTATFHSIYNLLVAAPGGWQIAGYILPLVAAAIVGVFIKRPFLHSS